MFCIALNLIGLVVYCLLGCVIEFVCVFCWWRVFVYCLVCGIYLRLSLVWFGYLVEVAYFVWLFVVGICVLFVISC